MVQRIYFDTNQIYFIRRIADECEGNEFGDYSWAFEVFPKSPEMIADIKALCYIVALQNQWDLEFCPSDASYTELFRSIANRALKTREAWDILGEENLIRKAQKLVPIPEFSMHKLHDLEIIPDRLRFITDKSDREIVRDFMKQEADTLLTSDYHILRHKSKLSQLGIMVMRPHEWINEFLKDIRGVEDGVAWVERILFTIGS